ncbi:MAG: hypothetical protein QXR48_01055 [Candidatus Woesearchaeota archaeon]
MLRIILLLFVLLVFAGCVQVPVDETTPPEGIQEPVFEPQTIAAEMLARNTSGPTPLAPLPDESKPSVPVVRPKAIVPNITNSSAINRTAQMQKGWTTEPISIEEGETKYVYIKQ